MYGSLLLLKRNGRFPATEHKSNRLSFPKRNFISAHIEIVVTFPTVGTVELQLQRYERHLLRLCLYVVLSKRNV